MENNDDAFFNKLNAEDLKKLNEAVSNVNYTPILPVGQYTADYSVFQGKVYSSLIGKWIDAKTGEVIDE